MSRALLLRTTAAFAAIASLTGGVVVSCSGDPLDSTGTPGDNRPSSHAMGRWQPDARYNDECPQSLHDSYFVVGPDGKKYPTWHPPSTTDPATDKTCYFGHEHGQDPREA
ncbi:MAG TPA: hypothetical protein VFR86_06505, partial [Burkholderiaceae bacterium]|nr:hypothetical protein [Burkholderiaceae bacterium]